MKTKRPKKKQRVTDLPTEQAIEQLLPKEIVDELRAATTPHAEESEEPTTIERK